MRLSFLSKNTDPTTKSSSSSSWQWPSCKQQPKTLSFRAGGHDIIKTLNSAYNLVAVAADLPESCFTNSSESESFSTSSEENSGGGDCIETVIRGLRSDRLFFEPEETSSLIMAEAKSWPQPPPLFKEDTAVVVSMESKEPYLDFKKSMEEMVEAHGLKEWDCLEELLCWYLRVNGKENHGFIFGAFVDLLVGLLAFSNNPSTSESSSSSSTSTSCGCSFSSPLSFTSSSCTTPCSSSSLQAEIVLEEGEEDEDDDDDDDDDGTSSFVV